MLLSEGGELLQPLLQQHGGHGHLPGVRGDPDLGGVGETGGAGGQSCRPPGLLAGEHSHQAAAPSPQAQVEAGGEGDDGGGGGCPGVGLQSGGQVLLGCPHGLLRPHQSRHHRVDPLPGCA